MQFRIDVYHHNADKPDHQLAAILTVEQSAITLIQGLAAQIAANATYPAKVQALADEITAKSTALAAAISATPPAP